MIQSTLGCMKSNKQIELLLNWEIGKCGCLCVKTALKIPFFYHHVFIFMPLTGYLHLILLEGISFHLI